MRRRLVLRFVDRAAVALLLAAVGLLIAVDVGGRLPRQVVVVLLPHPQPDDLPAGRRQVGLELSLALAQPLQLALVRDVLPEQLQLLALQLRDLVAQSFLLEKAERLVS